MSGNADLNDTNVNSTAPADIRERYMAEEIDLHNDQFNSKVEDIKMARQKMIYKIVVEKSADDKSSLSKGRKGARAKKSKDNVGMFGSTISGGKGSMDESLLNQSLQDSPSQLNRSISRKKDKDQNKAKHRDFNANPSTLTMLNANGYDKIDDMTQMRLGCGENYFSKQSRSSM